MSMTMRIKRSWLYGFLGLVNQAQSGLKIQKDPRPHHGGFLVDEDRVFQWIGNIKLNWMKELPDIVEVQRYNKAAGPYMPIEKGHGVIHI